MRAARVVLDSFALIAYFRGEPSADLVRDFLIEAATRDLPVHTSEVNYAEVKYQLCARRSH